MRVSLGFRLPNITAAASAPAIQALERALADFLFPSAFIVKVLSICGAVPPVCPFQSSTLPSRRLLSDESSSIHSLEEPVGAGRALQPAANLLVTVSLEILFSSPAALAETAQNVTQSPQQWASAVGSALAAVDPALFGGWVATAAVIQSSSVPSAAVVADDPPSATSPLLAYQALIGSAIGVAGGIVLIVAAFVVIRWKLLRGRSSVAPLDPKSDGGVRGGGSGRGGRGGAAGGGVDDGHGGDQADTLVYYIDASSQQPVQIAHVQPHQQQQWQPPPPPADGTPGRRHAWDR
jgi:hypothetical protein